MKLKLDENLPAELVGDLQAAGHEARSVQEEGLQSEPDAVILKQAQAEKRVLLTLDKGLGDLRTYPPSHYQGIVLLRPPTAGRGATLTFARQHLPELLALDLTGRLVVVTERGVRWR